MIPTLVFTIGYNIVTEKFVIHILDIEKIFRFLLETFHLIEIDIFLVLDYL